MTFEPTLVWAIVLLPLLGFVVNGVVALAAPERKIVPTIVGPAVIAISFAIALVNFFGMLRTGPETAVIVPGYTWIPSGSLQVEASLQLDQLSMLMTLIITGVGFLIHLYSVGYMHADKGYARYFAYINLFVFFMLLLVLGSSFPLMFVGWEGVGLCSYLLIGFWYTGKVNADAGKKAFIVNRIGDFGFIVAMLMIFANTGSLSFQSVFAAAPSAFTYGGAVVTAITLFLFLGATGKSAQIPLYVWLPDAMAGPTPVSALIHAATMVTAGVYMVARTGVLFALAPVSMIVVAGIGALTALFAATIGLAQYDIKKVLAYSTVSQLGYMFVGVGVGAYSAGIFHLMTHAFFKALLFLGSGAVIHAMHEALHHTHRDWDAQDMRNMGGLRRYLPITFVTMWVGTLAIAGVWPFAGFFSKDEIIWQVAARAVGPFRGWFTLYWVMALVAALLTAFYMTRLMIMTFHGKSRLPDEERHHLHEVPWVMYVPLVLLAVLSVLGGWINVPAAIGRMPVLGWVPHAEWLHHWLEPVTAAAERIQAANLPALSETAPFGGGEALWALVSFAIAVATIVIASAVISRVEYRPALESAAPAGFRRVLFRKWYVDEIYDALVVRPVIRASRWLWRWIDQGLIDGVLVNGAARLSRMVGWFGSRLQTGQINTYAFAVVLGVIFLFLFVFPRLF
ncbi:MAG: NADH-quinone oxidoreductase subunit L [Gemmatimonadetes bacterium]|nr:NADH-quinone oxidoreductase subunit L [Gemmatimonadota bacterium]